MIYKAEVAACSESRAKHSSEHHVEFFNVKPGGTLGKETARL